jgi:hypothetical protein
MAYVDLLAVSVSLAASPSWKAELMDSGVHYWSIHEESGSLHFLLVNLE